VVQGSIFLFESSVENKILFSNRAIQVNIRVNISDSQGMERLSQALGAPQQRIAERPTKNLHNDTLKGSLSPVYDTKTFFSLATKLNSFQTKK
jgi:hypothetical protein